MSFPLENQAARTTSLQQKRQILLQKLARVKGQIATTQQRLTVLAARMAVLAPAKCKAA